MENKIKEYVSPMSIAVICAALVVLILGMKNFSTTADAKFIDRGVTVTGTGEVEREVEFDIISANFNIPTVTYDTRKGLSVEDQREIRLAENAIIEKAKALGFDEKKIEIGGQDRYEDSMVYPMDRMSSGMDYSYPTTEAADSMYYGDPNYYGGNYSSEATWEISVRVQGDASKFTREAVENMITELGGTSVDVRYFLTDTKRYELTKSMSAEALKLARTDAEKKMKTLGVSPVTLSYADDSDYEPMYWSTSEKTGKFKVTKSASYIVK